jgi:hypothetical protein
MYRGNKIKASVYHVLAAEQHVKTVGEALMGLFPKPTDKMTFVLSKTWTKLSPEETSLLLTMHKQFQDSRHSFILHGIKDSSVEIKKEPNSTEVLSVHRWIKGQGTFDNVEPQLLSGK